MPQVTSDTFPATVRITSEPTGEVETLREARVFVVDGDIVVAVSAPSGPTIALDAPLSGLSGTRTRRQFTAQTATNPSLRVEWSRAEGCGCGSRLKAMNLSKFFTQRAQTQPA